MSQLLPILQEEIAARGPISFARFMELALYHPRLGYYEQGFGQTGRQGDFYTNVSVGQLFGEILGFNFARLLHQLPAPVVITEAGAHDGRLAVDLLTYLKSFQPALFEQVTYHIIEPSPRRTYRQHELLEPFAPRVQWFKSFADRPPVRGLCFSNELLDAFPVHLVSWNARDQRWHEQLVGCHHDQLAFLSSPAELSPDLAQLLPHIPPSLGKVLPDRFTLELSPARIAWWKSACQSLAAGSLIAFDYGGLRDWFLQPERADGTLRGYSKHRLMRDLLRSPGTQDLTASVNFSELIEAGETLGWTTGKYTHQGTFLKEIVEQIDAAPSEFPLWTAHRFRQLTSLIHPEHLGRSFKVLMQRKPSACAVAPSSPAA